MTLLARRSLVLATLLVAAATATGCGPGDDDGGPGPSDCAANLVPGDLVITEVMANPMGDDSGNEWFELYNAGSQAIDLSGVVLVVSKADGSAEKTHPMVEVVLQPGDYLVAGDILPELKPAWVDYGYANALGGLVNGGGLIAIRCDDAEIDSFEYPEAPGSDGGVTTILDGNVAPDHLANDEAANLCASTVAFAGATGVTGSPGEANEACNVVVPGTCLDGGASRATVPPVLGDLVISEFMPGPDVVSDTEGEWFEVYVAATVDLNGVVAGRTVGTPQASISSPDCVTAAAGSYVLFARNADGAMNGGLPEVDATFNFSLVGGTVDSPGSIFVGLGDEVLDQVSWTTSETGASTALKADQLDPVANDVAANYVTCEAAYGADGNTGTPGAANDTCATPEGMCNDGGTFRAIVAPTAGQLRITEALADPASTGTDTAQEWFEIRATAAFDLNGVGFNEDAADTVALTLSSVDCIEMADGDVRLFARNAIAPPDVGNNGGLPTPDFLFSFSLNNSNTGRLFASVGGAVIETFIYDADDGNSFQLDPGGTTLCLTPETVPYGTAANLGTPRAVNPACP